MKPPILHKTKSEHYLEASRDAIKVGMIHDHFAMTLGHVNLNKLGKCTTVQLTQISNH